LAGPGTVTRDQGVAMATVHVLAGPAVLAAAAAAAGVVGGTGAEGKLSLVGVTVLTSHDTGDFERVVGRGVPDLGFEAERLARLAVAAGLAGVVASGDELTLLREALGPNPWLVVPGVRAANEATGDQKRTVTAAEAVRRGATHLVVGRPITQASDPVRVYERLLETL
jgi:orotidine-5'-phosphate decarboxylase